jgi:hypothetical protein
MGLHLTIVNFFRFLLKWALKGPFLSPEELTDFCKKYYIAKDARETPQALMGRFEQN